MLTSKPIRTSCSTSSEMMLVAAVVALAMVIGTICAGEVCLRLATGHWLVPHSPVANFSQVDLDRAIDICAVSTAGILAAGFVLFRLWKGGRYEPAG